MIDRELIDAISQLLDVKLTNELGPIKYEINPLRKRSVASVTRCARSKPK